MKIRCIALAAMLIVSVNTHAASGIFESYGIIKINASTNVYYDMQATTVNPDFQGANFGTFNTGVGNTLTLVGGEIKTFKNGGSDVTGAFFNYRVFKVGDSPGSFIEFGLPFGANLPAPGDQRWDKTNQNVNLLSGLGNGNYTLEVFARATATGPTQTHFSNNGGANYTASFTVIPEPASAVLGLLGSVLLVRRRRI